MSFKFEGYFVKISALFLGFYFIIKYTTLI